MPPGRVAIVGSVAEEGLALTGTAGPHGSTRPRERSTICGRPATGSLKAAITEPSAIDTARLAAPEGQTGLKSPWVIGVDVSHPAARTWSRKRMLSPTASIARSAMLVGAPR